MKSTFLQIGIQQEFPQLVKNPAYCLDVAFALIFGIDKDIIQIHNNEDIKFFCEDLIDVALEYCRSVGQSKRHHRIFEVAVSGLESSFPLISFANSYWVVGTNEVKLSKPPRLPQLIQNSPTNGSGYRFLIVRLLSPR